MHGAFQESAYREKRRILIDQLRDKGIGDEALLQAMMKLPRELFVDQAFIGRTYEDTALPIECGQTISQPYTVAYMTEKLRVQPGHNILEIGTGSGYQACLLYLMGARVFSVERHQILFETVNRLFDKYDIKVNCLLGDGTLGWQEFAPYDRIIVTAAAPKIPSGLIDQLKPGGRMVVPVGNKSTQIMQLIIKTDKSNYRQQSLDKFKFVPLIGEQGWEND